MILRRSTISQYLPEHTHTHTNVRASGQCESLFVPDTDLTWVGVHRCALKQDSGGAVAQRAVHHIAVSCDPADVRHTAKHVAVPVVKDVLLKAQGGQTVTERDSPSE